MKMKTSEFNEHYEVNRRARGVKATAKTPAPKPIEIPLTADGTTYDAEQTHHFFDPSTQQVRQSIGRRRDGEYLATFGSRVIPVGRLHLNRDDALAKEQDFFKDEIERLVKRSAECESEKNKQV